MPDDMRELVALGFISVLLLLSALLFLIGRTPKGMPKPEWPPSPTTRRESIGTGIAAVLLLGALLLGTVSIGRAATSWLGG